MLKHYYNLYEKKIAEKRNTEEKKKTDENAEKLSALNTLHFWIEFERGLDIQQKQSSSVSLVYILVDAYIDWGTYFDTGWK